MGSSRASLNRRLAGLGMAAAAALALATVTATPASAAGRVLSAGDAAISDSYIVVFKRSAVSAQDTAALSDRLADKHDAKIERRYSHALRGFAGTMSEKAAKKLAADPSVDFVQQNGVVTLAATQNPTPSWGLDRIDQETLPLNNSYTYPDSAGAGVTAYIIDTGIRTTHQDFGGRAVWGTNTTGDGNNTDCNGHGTHVASTTAGTAYGVAKRANLVAVKVLNCAGSGSFAGVAQGIDWVTGQHAAGAPAVANMSLGASGSDAATENAVRNSIADGVTYSLASGNSNSDACNFTPARVAEAITVNASTSGDARASFSNWGTCTDIFAPGQDITAAWITNDSATNTISGTSMAAPHVAGGAALILGANPSATPAQVWNSMNAAASLNRISNPGTGSPNKLLRVGAGDPPPPGAPTVANPGTRTGTVGVATSLQMTATGGITPYTWSATGLPPGLSINPSSGLISGTPTTAGTYSVTVRATNASGGLSGTASFQWIINPPGGGCSGGGEKVTNGGFESGTTGWANATWTIGAWTGGAAPRTGVRNSWISGYGYTSTETLQTTVTIPAGCTNSTLNFYLKIVTSEYEPAVFDSFTARVGSTVLATYTNLNPSSTYVLRSFNVGAFAGQTVTISFTGTEDWSYQTSFLLDDVSLVAS
jgi:subtilisin family serine protease